MKLLKMEPDLETLTPCVNEHPKSESSSDRQLPGDLEDFDMRMKVGRNVLSGLVRASYSLRLVPCGSGAASRIGARCSSTAGRQWSTPLAKNLAEAITVTRNRARETDRDCSNGN